jgi:hypothetical protein
MDERVEILLKEYDVMRNDIRLYINKYYISQGLLFVLSSITLLAVSIYSYWRVNTKVREEVCKLNEELKVVLLDTNAISSDKEQAQ